MAPGGPSIRDFVANSCSSRSTLSHKNREMAEALKGKIESSERERKELAEHPQSRPRRAKKSFIAQPQTPRLPLHLGDRNERAEGARCSSWKATRRPVVTATRDVTDKAVFALKGKPLNTFAFRRK